MCLWLSMLIIVIKNTQIVGGCHSVGPISSYHLEIDGLINLFIVLAED